MHLTTEQIATFKADGVLVLPGFIAPELCDTWQGRFWQHIKADRDDATSWPGEYVHPGGVEVDWGIPGVELSDHPPMIGICEQLMGVGKFKKGLRPPNPKFGETEENKETDCMTVNWPTQEPWRRPAGGHIEGGNGKKDGWKGAFMMGAITILEDVNPMGGGLFFWPRSHLAAHGFFLARPEAINPNAHPHPAWNEHELSSWSEYREKPVEWVGRKGDTLLWHHWMVHQGSSNALDFPRLGLFARWYHADIDTMKYDIGGILSDRDLWRYWTDEVKAIEPSSSIKFGEDERFVVSYDEQISKL